MLQSSVHHACALQWEVECATVVWPQVVFACDFISVARCPHELLRSCSRRSRTWASRRTSVCRFSSSRRMRTCRNSCQGLQSRTDIPCLQWQRSWQHALLNVVAEVLSGLMASGLLRPKNFQTTFYVTQHCFRAGDRLGGPDFGWTATGEAPRTRKYFHVPQSTVGKGP